MHAGGKNQLLILLMKYALDIISSTCLAGGGNVVAAILNGFSLIGTEFTCPTKCWRLRLTFWKRLGRIKYRLWLHFQLSFRMAYLLGITPLT
jgi:hypothetical protein